MGRLSHERLSGVGLVREPLPRTALGKVRRHLLPELYAAALGGTAARTTARPSADDTALLAVWPAQTMWRALVSGN